MQTLEYLEIHAKLETIRVCALHALAYTQDAAVFAGRRLHT